MSSRRGFLRHALTAGAGLWLAPELVIADPYRPALHRRLIHPSAGAGLQGEAAKPVRVRGRVASGGQGLAGVRISDGFDVTLTREDGTYELLTSDRQRFVFMSVPSGHRVPASEAGTAAFFAPITGASEQDVSFRLDRTTDDTAHSFLALGDTQTQTAFEMGRLHAESVPDMARLAQRMNPAFGIAVGDIMFDDLSLFPEYERAVRRIGVPFFQAVGNHDLNLDAAVDPDSIRTFERHFGPSYYSFDCGEVHYVVLDSVMWHGSGYIGHIGADQLAWLERDLSYVEAGRTVVTFLHIPALSTQAFRRGERSPGNTVSVTNREHLYRLLEPYKAHLISGHTHENEHVFEGGTHEHILGTTCGAWWSDQICHDGTPNGYAVYEVSGGEVSWRYKGTGLPFSNQMRLYPAGSIPDRPTHFAANIWDWDPAWNVVWLEDGLQRGRMESVVARDPLAVARFDGEDVPAHRPWVQPVLTNHLLTADLSGATGSVTVEATDRFGRVYTAQLS